MCIPPFFFNQLSDSLGGVNFITEEGVGITGYTLTGADTFNPFSSGAWTNFGQGEFLNNSASKDLVITANMDYDSAFLVFNTNLGPVIEDSAYSTNGNGTITRLEHTVTTMPIYCFILKNIKMGDTITITASQSARFNYLIWY